MDPANSVLNRLERKKTARFPFLSSENISAVRLRWELGTGAGEKKVGGAKSSVHPCRETRCLRRALCSAEGEKKEAEGLVPFLHLVRFGSLQGIARLWLDGAQSVSQCSRCRPLSLPPLPPTSTTTPTLYSLSSGNGHRFSSSFFSHCIHSSPSGVFVSTALCHRHPAFQHLSQHKLRFAQLIELSILLAQCFVQQQWIRYVLQSQKKKNISFSD